MENFQDQFGDVRQLNQSVVATLMRSVYYWMAAALAITGLTAWVVANNPAMVAAIFSSKLIYMGLFIAEFVLVIALTAAINKMSFMTATIMFIVYSVLNGVVLSSIFIVFTESSVASTFFICAAMFISLAIFGSVTKKDLSGIGRFLFMALIGLIIASLVNVFMASTGLYWIITFAGVLIFAGLTAWDAQKIQNMLAMCDDVDESTQKIALLGSLSLYLDFINMFLYLLRLFGNRK